jgi:DNA-directed RNA polymerase specialized sigma24 family protein
MTEHANGPVTFAASTNPGPDEEFFRQERLAIKDQVLRMLREPCRELIRLCVDEGLDYREVARRQNRSYDAVRRQWCDCLKEATRLREAAERLVREPGGRVR